MNINIDENLLKNIFNSEVNKTVGKCMKRFELSENKEEIKRQTKEILYESYRDLRDLIIHCSNAKESIHLTLQNKKREE